MSVFKAGAATRAVPLIQQAYKPLTINILQIHDTGRRLRSGCKDAEKIKSIVSSKLEMLLNTPVEISSGKFARTNFSLQIKIPNVIEVEAGTVNVSDYCWGAIIPEILNGQLPFGYQAKVIAEEKYGKR